MCMVGGKGRDGGGRGREFGVREIGGSLGRGSFWGFVRWDFSMSFRGMGPRSTSRTMYLIPITIYAASSTQYSKKNTHSSIANWPESPWQGIACKPSQ